MELFIIEGADGLGKTTLAKALHQYLSDLLYQNTPLSFYYRALPNKNGEISFIHDLVKTDFSLTSLERQLFHCVSNCFELLTEPLAKENSIFVYDRSPISTLVYGETFGINETKSKYLKEIYKKAFRAKFENAPITYFILYGDKPFKELSEEDPHETNFKQLNDNYIKITAYMQYIEKGFLSDNEHYNYIDVSGKSSDEVLKEILNTSNILEFLNTYGE